MEEIKLVIAIIKEVSLVQGADEAESVQHFIPTSHGP